MTLMKWIAYYFMILFPVWIIGEIVFTISSHWQYESQLWLIDLMYSSLLLFLAVVGAYGCYCFAKIFDYKSKQMRED